MKALAQNREILLLRAVTLEQAGRIPEAHGLLEQIQNRWPEWAAAWAADGIVFGREGKRREAIGTLQTAVALGTNSAEVKRYLEELSAGSQTEAPDITLVLSPSFRSR